MVTIDKIVYLKAGNVPAKKNFVQAHSDFFRDIILYSQFFSSVLSKVNALLQLFCPSHL